MQRHFSMSKPSKCAPSRYMWTSNRNSLSGVMIMRAPSLRILRDPFAVMNCICRQAREKMGEKCKQTDILETCFTLGDSATYMMEHGSGP